ncbi:MAG TPA: lysophospholipid acyltransferase family protein [Polyangiaceae bacterium]|jgi:1-acyl-sn-glycerol-3-phosphate acyltransferase|nr:lysophospholipid acyltransferase family protein [Polyangiaceae bacterium]
MTLRHLANAAFHTLRICVPTVIDAALGRLTTPICDARLDSWSAALVHYAKIELDVSGLEHAAGDEAFVVMSNHRSHYDIPVLFQALRPRRLRMVAKTELFRVPIWAGAMRAAGFVEVNRANRIAAMRSLERARDAIRAGTSIWIAPEGTRGSGEAMGPFKKGGFHLAVGAEARILPVAVLGTERILPARGTRVSDGERVRVIVGEPIEPRAQQGPGMRDLMALVRTRIEAGLASG